MPPDKNKLALFVFIDAFGWEILRRHPFLDDLLRTKIPLGTVLGYSSACDPTILTGKLPREHGHFSFFCYNPAESPFGICRFLRILPRFITRRSRVRQTMSKVLRRYYGYTGYFQTYSVPFQYLPLFDYSEKHDIYQPGGINGGVPTIFDHLRDKDLPFYLSDWREKEEKNIESLEGVLDERRVVFAYLYLADMDALLHAHGTGSPAVDEKIRWYDRRLRSVIRRAQKNYETVHVYIFSDHGMTDVTEECDLMVQIDRLGLRFGIDYAAIYDSTMARFWFLSDLAREKVVDALKAEPRGQVLSEEQAASYGCDFANHRYGEIFFLVNPGVLICPSFMGETHLAGMHGYEPHHKDSPAMFASNVVSDPVPRRLDDLYDLMLKEVSC